MEGWVPPPVDVGLREREPGRGRLRGLRRRRRHHKEVSSSISRESERLRGYGRRGEGRRERRGWSAACLPASFPPAARVLGAIYGTAMRTNMRTGKRMRGQRRRREDGANSLEEKKERKNGVLITR